MRNLIAGGCGVEGTRSHGSGRMVRTPACLTTMPPHGAEKTSTKHLSRVAFGMELADLPLAGIARSNGRSLGSTAISRRRGRVACSQTRHNGEAGSHTAQMRCRHDTELSAAGQHRQTREEVLHSRQISLFTPRMSEFANEIMGSVTQHHFFGPFAHPHTIDSAPGFRSRRAPKTGVGGGGMLKDSHSGWFCLQSGSITLENRKTLKRVEL